MKTKKKRIRKSTKYFIIIVSIILLIFSVNSFINNLKEENKSLITKEIYKYTDKFSYDYTVNLVKNKYMTNEDVEDKTLAYVTDLIDNIDLNLNYNYTGSKASGLNCTYSVEGKMQVVYTKDGEEQKIWEKSDTLLKQKNKKIDDNKLEIKENLKLDLKDKNRLLNEFKQQLGMSIDAKYTITLKINVLTSVEGKEIENESTPVINIDLAEKTTKISGENDVEKTQFVSKEFKVTEEQSKMIIIMDVIIIIIALLLIRYALVAETINKVRNEYKYELNRILKICQDKIVEVSTKPSDEEQEIVFVKDFGEIVKISEELFKPILYYSQSEEEAWFSVISGKTSYRYILKK